MEETVDLQSIKDALQQASERVLKHPNVRKFDVWWIRMMVARELKFVLPEGEYWRLITTHTDLVRDLAEEYAWDVLKNRSSTEAVL